MGHPGPEAGPHHTRRQARSCLLLLALCAVACTLLISVSSTWLGRIGPLDLSRRELLDGRAGGGSSAGHDGGVDTGIVGGDLGPEAVKKTLPVLDPDSNLSSGVSVAELGAGTGTSGVTSGMGAGATSSGGSITRTGDTVSSSSSSITSGGSSSSITRSGSSGSTTSSSSSGSSSGSRITFSSSSGSSSGSSSTSSSGSRITSSSSSLSSSSSSSSSSASSSGSGSGSSSTSSSSSSSARSRSSSIVASTSTSSRIIGSSISSRGQGPPHSRGKRAASTRSKGTSSTAVSCKGRRIYTVDLGEEFHRGLLQGQRAIDKWHQTSSSLNGGFGAERGDTRSISVPRRSVIELSASALLEWKTDMEQNTDEKENEEEELGEQADGAQVVRKQAVDPAWPDLSSTWFDTWTNSLDVVFHSRMRTFPCRVDSIEEADLFYVPYYGSLDISTHVGQDRAGRGHLGKALSDRLRAHPAYQRNQGRDVFVVLGRPYWDFIANLTDPSCTWGSGAMRTEAFLKAQIVTVERPNWVNNTIGAPYPTAFHPPGRQELQQWVEFVRGARRPLLFAFAGARRQANREHQIDRAVAARNAVFWQCERSSRCQVLDCENPKGRCEHDWRAVTRLYLGASFCIHPRGDSCTRRAVLDSMLAGCIPVVLEQCTVDWQYEKLLGPADAYSIRVDGEKLKEGQDGGLELEQVLGALEPERVERMRRKVLELVPKITFGGCVESNSVVTAPDFEDAVMPIVDQVWKNVQETIRTTRGG